MLFFHPMIHSKIALVVLVAAFFRDQRTSTRRAGVMHQGHRQAAGRMCGRDGPSGPSDATFLVNLLMAFEVALDGEGAVASHAFKRLLARVAVAMNFQTAWTRESFAAAGLHALVSMMLRAQGWERVVVVVVDHGPANQS